MSSSKGRSPANRPGYPSGIQIAWKEREDALETRALTIDGYIGVRCDGRAFHTYTQAMERPFDERMVDAMEAAARMAADSVPGVVLAFWQSDEISAFIANRSPKRHDDGMEAEGLPFGGRVQKIASAMASSATAGFIASIAGRYESDQVPTFDARLFMINDDDELIDYLRWRRADSRKNAVSATAVARFGHAPLLNKSTHERLEMLEEVGEPPIRDDLYHGALLRRVEREERTEWIDASGAAHEATACRHRWEKAPATDEQIAAALAEIRERQGR